MIGEVKKISERVEKESTKIIKKKRGRKPKNYSEEYKLNLDQKKFFVDLSKEERELNKVFKLLDQANKKDYGKEITFKDIALYALDKLNPKDIERVQELSMSEMEKVERTLNEYNKKNGTTLSLGEFLVKKLNIN